MVSCDYFDHEFHITTSKNEQSVIAVFDLLAYYSFVIEGYIANLASKCNYLVLCFDMRPCDNFIPEQLSTNIADL